MSLHSLAVVNVAPTCVRISWRPWSQPLGCGVQEPRCWGPLVLLCPSPLTFRVNVCLGGGRHTPAGGPSALTRSTRSQGRTHVGLRHDPAESASRPPRSQHPAPRGVHPPQWSPHHPPPDGESPSRPRRGRPLHPARGHTSGPHTTAPQTPITSLGPPRTDPRDRTEVPTVPRRVPCTCGAAHGIQGNILLPALTPLLW